jgi:hypothetical protein
MKINKLAFMVAIAAGVICLGNFIYQYIKFNKKDYNILLAGVFIAAVITSSGLYLHKPFASLFA